MQKIANLEESLLETLRHLSPEKQQEVLDFAEFAVLDSEDWESPYDKS